jgi:hypothetical protein
MFNMFAGGAVGRMAIFALGIMPYISASIIMQLMTSIVSRARGPQEGRRAGPQDVINQYTRYLTVILALFQAYGIAIGLEGAANVVIDPGMFFRISTVITLTGGTMFLMWLGEQITSRGIGNGISLIIFSGIVADLPSCAGRYAGARPPGRDVDGADPDHHRDGDRVIALHRLRRARAAPAADPVPEAPGRQQDVRGRILAPAAEAQHLGRDSADLRVVAAAAADHARELLGNGRPARSGSTRSPPWSATASRCTCCSMRR